MIGKGSCVKIQKQIDSPLNGEIGTVENLNAERVLVRLDCMRTDCALQDLTEVQE
jgi:hypothetical protein